jgi:hypothetical protein
LERAVVDGLLKLFGLVLESRASFFIFLFAHYAVEGISDLLGVADGAPCHLQAFANEKLR